MTLDEIRKSRKDMLTAKDVSGCLGMNSARITEYARLKREPYRLPFPYIMSGNRVKIPRAAFLRWADGIETPEDGMDPEMEIR